MELWYAFGVKGRKRKFNKSRMVWVSESRSGAYFERVDQTLEVRLDERLTDRSFLSVDFSASFYWEETNQQLRQTDTNSDHVPSASANQRRRWFATVRSTGLRTKGLTGFAVARSSAPPARSARWWGTWGKGMVEELRQTIVWIRRFEKTRKWPVTKKISFRQGLHMKMMVLDITANEPAPLGNPEGRPKRVHQWLQFVFSL